MPDAIFTIPPPYNEPIYNYGPGSPEKIALKQALSEAKSSTKDIPMYIGGQHIFTEDKIAMRPPHETAHVLGHYSKGTAAHVNAAIEAALQAKPTWEAMSWEETSLQGLTARA